MSSEVRITSNRCVNSHWVARWLAKEEQEHCECMVECKVICSYRNYNYVVTQAEYESLLRLDETVGKLNKAIKYVEPRKKKATKQLR